MFCNKKIKPKQDNQNNESPIDIAWVTYIGMNKLGFTYRQVGELYLGTWVDLFEAFKAQYNFETGNGLYEDEKEEERGSLLDL